MRSTIARGTEFRSGTEVAPENTGIKRWPSISTRVRVGPRPRRPTSDRPTPPLLLLLERPPLEKSGPVIRFRTSSTLCALVSWISAWVATESGLGLSVLPLILEPVMTTSVTSLAGPADAAASAATAAVPDSVMNAAPQIIEDARRRPRVVLMCKI